MTDATQTTQRPVVVYYSRDVDPTPDHPDGFTQGQTFVVSTPEAAKAVHPGADIMRYEDGSEFNLRKSNAELRERDNPEPKTRKTKAETETPSETPSETPVPTDDAKAT